MKLAPEDCISLFDASCLSPVFASGFLPNNHEEMLEILHATRLMSNSTEIEKYSTCTWNHALLNKSFLHNQNISLISISCPNVILQFSEQN